MPKLFRQGPTGLRRPRVTTSQLRPRRTQQQRRSEAEQGLITAAAEIIGESGPASLTLAKVGERAGYSHGLAAHYFGSKGALIARVAEAVSRQFRDAFVATAGADGSLVDAMGSFLTVFF